MAVRVPVFQSAHDMVTQLLVKFRSLELHRIDETVFATPPNADPLSLSNKHRSDALTTQVLPSSHDLDLQPSELRGAKQPANDNLIPVKRKQTQRQRAILAQSTGLPINWARNLIVRSQFEMDRFAEFIVRVVDHLQDVIVRLQGMCFSLESCIVTEPATTTLQDLSSTRIRRSNTRSDSPRLRLRPRMLAAKAGWHPLCNRGSFRC